MSAVPVQRAVLMLILVGTLVRLFIALRVPATNDMETFRIAGAFFRDHGLDAYRYTDAVDPTDAARLGRYSYPPGLAPWWALIAPAGTVPFKLLSRLPAMLADAAIAWLVQGDLARRGADARTRVLATALVAFGPVFLAVTQNGQIDGVAVVPAIAALRCWEDRPSPSGPLSAGALIGLGASIKTFPLVFAVALAARARSGRDAAAVLAAAATVPLALTAPFFAAEPGPVTDSLTYSGIPGGGGLGVLVQPELVEGYLGDPGVEVTGVGDTLLQFAGAMAVGGLAFGAWLARRHRLPPAEACAAVAAAVLIASPNFFVQYLLWLLPFALIAGRLRWVAAAQVVMSAYLLATNALPLTHTARLGRLIPDGGEGAVMFVSVVALTVLLVVLLVSLAAGRRAPAARAGMVASP